MTKLPSDYIRSNVRVAIFPFEDIDVSIERYGLEDILCFATDYPHVEGGRDMINTLYNKIERLGERVIEKFFVDNGKFLMPRSAEERNVGQNTELDGGSRGCA